MSLSPNQLDQGAQHNMTIEGSSLRERQRPHARVCAIPRKAPHQQVIDEMKNEPMTPDRDFLIRNYPNLMNFYEDDLESVYEAAEEACCRIIAGTELPDFLQTLGDHSTADHSSTATKRQFYEAINDIQRNPLQKPNRGNLPREAVEKFKAWFEANEDHPYPSDEIKVSLSNETGVELEQITNWFINRRKRFWKHNLPDSFDAPLSMTSSELSQDLSSVES